MKKRLFLTVSTTILMSSFAHGETLKQKPVDEDYLDLLNSFAHYRKASDVNKVSKINSTFYTADKETTEELQKKAEETLAEYLKSKDVMQSSAAKVLIKSLNDAYDVSKKKLEIQKAAALAFEKASQEATKLDNDEQVKEESCLNGFSEALAQGSSVNNDCNNLEEVADQKSCVDELNACTAKIKADHDKFNVYLTKREKVQPSKAGYDLVNNDSKVLLKEIPSSGSICHKYTTSMYAAENGERLLEKLISDEKNESYQSPPVATDKMDIHIDLDSKMLIPKNRIEVWTKLKSLADEKVESTKLSMKKIKDYIEKLGGSLLTGEKGSVVEDGKLPWSEKEINDFLATNPSAEEIQKKIAGLNETQLDKLYHLEGMSRENITKLDQAITPGASPNGMWIKDKHFSKKEIKDFYANNGDDYNYIKKEMGDIDPWLARETMLKARMINGIDPADGDKRVKFYFDQYAKAHPDGVFANDFKGWLEEVKYDGRTEPAMRSGTFTGDPTDWTGKDYYERWAAGDPIAVPAWKPYVVPDHIWVNGEKLTKEKIQEFYKNGGNDYEFAKSAKLTPDEAHSLLPTARLINGLNPTDYETNLKYYFDQYTKSHPNGVYANNFSGWKNDQNPHSKLAMQSGSYSGDPSDKSPTDYCLEARMCDDPRIGKSTSAVAASSKATKVANPKVIQTTLTKTRDSYITLIQANPKAQAVISSAVTKVEKTLRERQLNDGLKVKNLKKIYSDLNSELLSLPKK